MACVISTTENLILYISKIEKRIVDVNFYISFFKKLFKVQ